MKEGSKAKTMKTIYFDMDGTIANLYGVSDWLPKLRAANASPYAEAAPLVNMEKLELQLLRLQREGYKVGIISWLAKGAEENYNIEVRRTKKEWLKRYFAQLNFDEVHIVKYGVRKDYVAKDKNGIIFDDDERVRIKWRGTAINPQTEDIIKYLEKLMGETK